MDRLECGGVPLFYEEGPEPAALSLVFRVGISDEPPTHRGITHLVEHLAMFEIGVRDHVSNGFVDLGMCTFFAQGTQQELERFVADVTRAIRELPLDRLDDEKSVLQRESAAAGPDVVARLMSYRFGLRGFGGGHLAELGLRWLDAEAITAWRDERFTGGNAAIWCHGPSPPNAELGLAAGDRFPLPPADPLPGQQFPAFVAEGTGGIGVSYTTDRSWAATVGLGIAQERLHERLRLQRALAYNVWSSYDIVGGDEAHLVIGTDCADHQADAAAEVLLDVIDDLAGEGPTEDELGRAMRLSERGFTEDPDKERRDLHRAALLYLTGRSPVSLEDELADLRELTVGDVRQRFEDAQSVLMLLGPNGLAKPREGLHDLERAPRELGGQEFEAKKKTDAGLYIGEAGVTWRGPDTTVAIPQEEIAVVQEDTLGTVLISGVDGAWIEFNPSDLKQGEEAVEAIRALAPEPFVPSDDMRAAWVKALAEKKLDRQWTLRDELSYLPAVLEYEEEPLVMSEAARGVRVGLLVLTDRRLLWLYAGMRKEEFLRVSRGDVRECKLEKRLLRSDALKVVLDEEVLEFIDFKPKERLREFAEALERPLS